MSDRYPGGIIVSNPTAPTSTSAPGIWTMEQAAYYIGQGLWPQPLVGDPYYQYVTALLHGDGANAGTNNTFLDSSSNAFTITRNGNTTQGSFSPYGSLWGNYFGGNGSGSYLTAPANAVFNFSTGDFTIEAWVYNNGLGATTATLLSNAANSGTTDWFRVKCDPAGFTTFSTNGADVVSTTISLNVWNHIAIVRNGSTVTLYVNGYSVSTASYSTTIGTNSGAVYIGTEGATDGSFTNRVFGGYVSNLRIVKGSAVYTANFTPSTTPLTAISNTSLLTCQSNRFIDTSSNAFTITVVGSSTQVTRFSPFGPTVSTTYSASTIGGSGYFDGTGDYLTAASNSAFAFGSGDFCIEFFVYVSSALSNYDEFVGVYPGSGNPAGWSIFVDTSKYLTFGTHTANLLVDTSAFPTNQWVHVAVSRSGTTLSMYRNGTRVATATDSTSLTQSGLDVMGKGTGNEPNGYMTDLRLVKGSSVYTPSNSTITIPTAPLTAITNTQLLLNYTNGAIYDNAEVTDIETVGNAQITTSYYKYGTGSINFDGAGDYLVLNNAASEYTFGTGNFTIEMWVQMYAYSGSNNTYLYDGRSSSTTDVAPSIYINTSGQIIYQTGSTTRITGTVMPAYDGYWGQWSPFTHIAICRANGVTKLFVGGVQAGSAYTDTNNYLGYASKPVIGCIYSGTSANGFNGHIDDIRITKGYARYWETFTPPTAAMPNFYQAPTTPTQDPQFNYTTLLLPGNGTNGAQNNTFLDSSTNAFTITRNGNTTQGTFTPFSQTGWSNYFGGSSSYLTLSNQPTFFLNQNFTIECWVYSSTANPTASFISQWGNGSWSQAQFSFGWNGSSGLALYVNTQYNGTFEYINAGGYLPANQWVHVAVTLDSRYQMRFFVNGTQIYFYNYGYLIQPRTTDVAIGDGGAFGAFVGYMSNLRMSNKALYTSNFTPSTTPLTTTVSNAGEVVLLTCNSNRFIDSSGYKNALTVNGSSLSVQAFSPFAPTAAYSASTVGGSGYFDGTGDYLSVADNAAFDVGSSDFTVECWVYSDFSGGPGIFGQWNSGGYAPISGAINSSYVYFTASSDGSNWDLVGTASSARMYNAWTHVAWVRYGNEWSIYVNGVKNIVSASQSFTPYNSTDPMVLGARYNGYLPLNGNISGFRFVKGTAVYTTTFTPPTAPPTAINNTSLLCNFTNAGITDATAKNDLETVGNAQISTSVSKFGGSSIAFDGTGDWLTCSQPINLPASSDFTIEGWFYLTAAQADFRMIMGESTGGSGQYFGIGSTGILFQTGATSGTQASFAYTFSQNTWYHIAVSRYGNTIYCFVNGNSLSGTNTSQSAAFLTSTSYIGVGYSSSYPWNGYMQDVRITKGYARYVQPFTPPAQADQLY